MENKAYNYFELTRKEKKELKDLTKENGGRARIFVHYGFITRTKTTKANIGKNYDKHIFETYLTEKHPKGYQFPTFFMVENSTLNVWTKVLNNIKKPLQHPIIIVPTADGYPIPYHEKIFKNQPANTGIEYGYAKPEARKFFKTAQKSFKKFTKQIQKLGIKKIMIGGEMSEYIHPFSLVSDKIWKGKEHLRHKLIKDLEKSPSRFKSDVPFEGCVPDLISALLSHSNHKLEIHQARAISLDDEGKIHEAGHAQSFKEFMDKIKEEE